MYSEDIYSVSNCHNVANHAEFYLGELWFTVTFTGNAECFKNNFTTFENVRGKFFKLPNPSGRTRQGLKQTSTRNIIIIIIIIIMFLGNKVGAMLRADNLAAKY
jgi:hypothetical protein